MASSDDRGSGLAGNTEGPRLALVGCGAIAESFYLPALKKLGVLGGLTLVDRDLRRIEALGDSYGIANRTSDYRSVLDTVDGVIVAVPHHLHAEISIDFLLSGVHVLCEKPLCETAEQVGSMTEAARTGGVSLAVNNTRRLFPSYCNVAELVASRQFGDIKQISYFEGGEFSWPTHTGFYFNSESGGKGVLLDRGAHVLDLACWWMGSKPELVSFSDDSFGGCEAVCEARFRAGSCDAVVRLSWLNKLRNTFTVTCEDAEISGSIYDWRRLTIKRPGSSRTELRAFKTKAYSFAAFADQLMSNFLDVIAGEAAPLVSPEDVAHSIGLIEDCYRHRQRFSMPWATR